MATLLSNRDLDRIYIIGMVKNPNIADGTLIENSENPNAFIQKCKNTG